MASNRYSGSRRCHLHSWHVYAPESLLAYLRPLWQASVVYIYYVKLTLAF